MGPLPFHSGGANTCIHRCAAVSTKLLAPGVGASNAHPHPHTQVERARAQVASLPHAGSYSDLCTSLRRQHDEEVAISATLQAQAQALERAEVAHERAVARLAKAGGEAAAGQGDAAGVVAALQEEVARLRQQVGVDP